MQKYKATFWFIWFAKSQFFVEFYNPNIRKFIERIPSTKTLIAKV